LAKWIEEFEKMQAIRDIMDDGDNDGNAVNKKRRVNRCYGMDCALLN
jgi:hypothetical protein